MNKELDLIGVTTDELVDILKGDSVYWLLRFGVKSPSSSGMDNCKDDKYYDLYNICCKLQHLDYVKENCYE